MSEWISGLLGFATGGGGSDSGRLQSSGAIPKDTLLEYFRLGKAEFEDIGLKQRLRNAHEAGLNPQKEIDAAQAAIFESLGVSGAYGLAYMAKVRKLFSNDAEMLRSFYEFVHLEERALDEAELTQQEFDAKYASVRQAQAMLKQREAELAGMDPKERDAVVARLYRSIVQASAQPGQRPCCSASGHAGGPCASAPPPRADVPPGTEDMSTDARPVDAPSTMPADEQLRFFQSISQSRGHPS